jgi:hypothetical protein
MNYWIWVVMLAIQQFSFTVVSRARNSNSVIYGGIASAFSNGIWFAQTIYMTGNFMEIIKNSDFNEALFMGFVYVSVNTVMSVVAQKVCMRWFERGK